MKTLTLMRPGAFELSETAAPEMPEPGQALVRVRRVGICGTDLHAYRGEQPFFSYPRILGHELGVEVLSTPDNAAGIRAGDRCAVEPYLHCGSCIACRKGKTNCCVHLRVLGVHTDGGMRERLLVPVSKLHRSDKLALDQLALVETLSIGARAVQRAQLQAEEFALVLGTGPIGLTVIQFAQAAGARVIALDINAHRLRFCTEQLGVPHSILHENLEASLATVRDITAGDLPTAVFDATGSAASMAAAFQYVAHGGRLVLVGIAQADVCFHDPLFHRRELTLLATRNATAIEFHQIIAQLEAGVIDTTPWITHRAGWDSFLRAFPSWLEPETGVIKAILDLD
jgi:2-desacetyl-2-hydroxyethyl bacteriochlorophyllide A dehydrogenase